MTTGDTPTDETRDAASPGGAGERSADDRVLRLIATAVPWIARAAWVLVAVIGGAAVERAVEGRSSGISWVAAIGGWSVFGVVALALVVPSVWSLTVVRVLAPLSLVVAAATTVGGAPAADVALLAVPSAIAVASIFTADLGRWMVQGSAYGDERRFPLRAPVAVGAAAMIAWVLWAAAVVVGPLAVAAGSLAVGIPVTIIALALAVVIGPRWHRMSLRWFVLVPAGLVVHDPVVLADTVMIRTAQVDRLGLARVDTEAADLTGPASGYAIEVRTRESVNALFAFTPSEPNGRAIHMTAFLVAPTRPGEVLRTAADRGFTVG